MKKLTEYLDADHERVMAGLQAAATPEAAQRILEKEADRLLLQYNEACTSVQVRDAASGMLQAVRSSVPFLDSMGEARVWRREDGAPGAVEGNKGSGAGSGKGGRGAGLSRILLGAAGAVLTAAAFFVPALLTGGAAALPGLLKGILLPLAGGGCLYLAGRAAGRQAAFRTGSGTGGGPAQERIEITVDAEKLWNSLRGAVLVVDRNLEIAQESEDYRRKKELAAGAGASAGKGISAEEIELFAGLLEMADTGSAQMAADIRYYLHKKDVEAVDWTPQTAAWFEMLPALPAPLSAAGGSFAEKAGKAGKPGKEAARESAARTGQTGGGNAALTVRPALVQGTKLLKKGVAVR